MAIQRTQRKIEIGPGRYRYRVTVLGEPCVEKTYEARIHHGLFLTWLADNQSLIQCGYSVPDRVVITHNGLCWQAEAEAETEEPL